MKLLFAYLGLFLLTSSLTQGQGIDRSLTNDPAFRQALSKTMRYPVAAQQAEKVAKAYIEFKVDRQGKVTNVQVLNQANVDASFNKEVNRFMSLLPAQKQTYAGTYVLPIVFELEGSDRTIKPHDEARSFLESMAKKSLLDTAYVTAYLK
jgi:TonB family protein